MRLHSTATALTMQFLSTVAYEYIHDYMVSAVLYHAHILRVMQHINGEEIK